MIISRRRRSVWPRPSRAKFLSLTQSVIHLRRRPRQDDHRHWSDDTIITNDPRTPHHDQRNRCRNHFRRCVVCGKIRSRPTGEIFLAQVLGKSTPLVFSGQSSLAWVRKSWVKRKNIAKCLTDFYNGNVKNLHTCKEVKGFKQKCGLDSHIKWSVWSLLHYSW